MKVLVCGGRNYADRHMLFTVLDTLHTKLHFDVLVCGGAPGADRLAEQWAAQRLVECRVYKANWAKYGKAAGPIRNRLMLSDERPSLVVAFPGGPGTDGMVAMAVDADGVDVINIGDEAVATKR